MPIQNAGTLLENLVLVESARLLARETASDARPLDVANAFAMPVFSEWRAADKYEYQTAFNTARLTRLVGLQLPVGSDYASLLQRCLRAHAGQGPNGALLVALLLRLEGRPVRLWANDLPDDTGHYPGALSSLVRIAPAVDELLAGSPPSACAARVCSDAYPSSLTDLSSTLQEWRRQQQPSARLGFLDPMRYTTEERSGPQTSPADHRDWLRRLREGFDGPVLAVHFTGNSMTTHLYREVASLAKDGQESGYATTRAFKTRHYVVSVNCHHQGGPDPASALADRLVDLVASAWSRWHQSTEAALTRPVSLGVFVDGQRVGPKSVEEVSAA